MSIQIRLENEGSDEELETDMLYSPQLALKLALTEWLAEFGEPHQYNSKDPPHAALLTSEVCSPPVPFQDTKQTMRYSKGRCPESLMNNAVV